MMRLRWAPALIGLAVSGQALAADPPRNCAEQWSRLNRDVRRGQFTDLVRLGQATSDGFKELRSSQSSEAGNLRYYDLAMPFTGAVEAHVVVNTDQGSALVMATVHVGTSAQEARQAHARTAQAFRALCPADVGEIREEIENGQPELVVNQLAPDAVAFLSIFVREPLAYGPKETQYEVVWFVRRRSAP